MNAAPRFARNKRELARFLGMSHPTLYSVLKLEGCPMPRADGRWPCAAIRKFALKSARKIEGPREEDRLRMELLKLKLRPATQELSEFEQKIRDQITAKVRERFKACVNILASRLKSMPRELACRCDGLGPQQVFKLSTDLLYGCFDAARREFEGRMPAGKEQPRVIPFETKESHGAMSG